MFEKYKACVLNEYRIKQIENQLSLNLCHPTAAKLKAESIKVCSSRFMKKDEKVLGSFFAPQKDASAYCLAIKKSEADLFKPLRNFLKGDTDNTQEKNIEMLAWLIDFEPRPYQIGKEYNILSHHVAMVAEVANIHKIDQVPNDDEQVITPRLTIANNWKKVALIGVLLVIAGAAAYELLTAPLLKHKDDIILMQPRVLAQKGDEKCMYWAADHFEMVPYRKRPAGVLVYKFNAADFTCFKKILKPETLTVSAIGKVWYFKSAGRVEYFTTEGFHPIYRDRRLKPLTDYIFKKYIYRGSHSADVNK